MSFHLSSNPKYSYIDLLYYLSHLDSTVAYEKLRLRSDEFHLIVFVGVYA